MSTRRGLWVILFRSGAACAIVAIWLLYLIQSYTLNQSKVGASIRFEEPVPAGDPVSNRIAFVGNEGQIWVVSPQGEELRRISRDLAQYSYPTWAPDGRYLAFTVDEAEGGGALYVSPASRGEPTPLARSLSSRPFYAYWAPDSRSITYLAREGDGMALRGVLLADPAANRRLSEGMPLFWAWAPDGKALLVHSGSSLFKMNGIGGASQAGLEVSSRLFHTPAWSADGSKIYYFGPDGDGGTALFCADGDYAEARRLADARGSCRLVVSPTGDRVAYLSSVTRARVEAFSRSGEAAVWDGSKNIRLDVGDFKVCSMYWSPDGAKLALLMLSRDIGEAPVVLGSYIRNVIENTRRGPRSRRFHWWVYDLEQDALSPVATFFPTTELFGTMSYFDQFHASHSFWSPDSRYLVTCALDGVPADGTVWVVDTRGEEPPRLIGDGGFAVWSWQ